MKTHAKRLGIVLLAKLSENTDNSFERVEVSVIFKHSQAVFVVFFNFSWISEY